MLHLLATRQRGLWTRIAVPELPPGSGQKLCVPRAVDQDAQRLAPGVADVPGGARVGPERINPSPSTPRSASAAHPVDAGEARRRAERQPHERAHPQSQSHAAEHL